MTNDERHYNSLGGSTVFTIFTANDGRRYKLRLVEQHVNGDDSTSPTYHFVAVEAVRDVPPPNPLDILSGIAIVGYIDPKGVRGNPDATPQ